MPMSSQPELSSANPRLRDGVNRCARCGSTEVQLRPSTGRLICLYCRFEWDEERVEEALGLGAGIGELRGTVIGSAARDIDATTNGVLTLKCSGCGSEVVIDTGHQLDARCHWCRHVLSVNDQVPNGAVPDAVLPFKLTQAQAVERIRAFAGRRRLFAHARFKSEFVPENVVGVYLPYMLVDGSVSAELQGHGEVETARYTRGSGKDEQTYYDADVYALHRRLDFTVDDLTLESSAERARFDAWANTNNIINTILPFDTKNAVRWNAAYLSGFSSEKRDQDVAALQPQLEQQLLSIARAQAQPTVRRYDRGVRWEREALQVHGTRWVSMYLPVWLYSYYHVERGRGMVHYVAVNARSGETMGSIPVARGKLLLAALAVGTFIEGLVLWLLRSQA